jgi:hypothetical protein
MADKEVLKDPEDDDVELVPVETPPEDKPEEGDDETPVDEPEDDEDERLGTREDEGEDNSNKKRRKQRREYAKRRREETAAELEALRLQNQTLTQRLSAVENHALTANESTIQQRLTQTLLDVQQAEEIFAKATSEGQGDYAMQAMRVRDAAQAEAHRLNTLQQQVRKTREDAEKAPPPPDPLVQRHSSEWLKDNPWYDPGGKDDISRLAKQVDLQIAAEGHNPATRGYWEELTRRVTAALTPAAKPVTNGRTAPPMGTTREHAPPSTKRNEFYVTPERKAAMVEAGAWDDPKRRQRVLKEYRDYDKAKAR